jgi:hypothetical protein
MKKSALLFLLAISFVSTSIFAAPTKTIIQPVNGKLLSQWGIMGGYNGLIEWMTGPDDFSSYKIQVHVNKYNSRNPSVPNDPVEFVCKGKIYKIYPDETGPVCEVNVAMPAFLYINPRDFYYGSDGTS